MDAELNQTNEQATQASEETEVKTFTQEEVNQIVQDRLHKDRKDQRQIMTTLRPRPSSMMNL